MTRALRAIGLWFQRFWFAQHNARVLADMEWRMILLVEEATGGRMSKAYYSNDQMRPEIAAHHNALYQDGWDDALAEVSADRNIFPMTPTNEPRPAKTGEWVLTEEMLRAGAKATGNYISPEAAGRVFQAMLAATPTPEPVDLGADAERGAVRDAYIAGATAVHEEWTRNPGDAPRGDPEFYEAADDYAQSVVTPPASVEATIERCARVLDGLATDEEEALEAGVLFSTAEDRGRTAIVARELRRAAKKVRTLSTAPDQPSDGGTA